MLNTEQAAAVTSIKNFLISPTSYFLLTGCAGTGKTYTIRYLVEGTPGRFVFTAPTNKATKVLRDSFQSEDMDYRPECRTIYSLLGLRMEPNGEIKELTRPECDADLSRFKMVIVDEASMVNAELWEHIQRAVENSGTKFLFLGDPAQLPPVKETKSKVWEIEARADLVTVMRHDNQILNLATRIREKVNHPAPSINIQTDASIDEGVWAIGRREFLGRIMASAEAGEFSKPNIAKAIAWRNVTVDQLNFLVRDKLYPGADKWVVGDRVIALEPIKHPVTEDILATTDDEGTISRVSIIPHPIYPEVECYNLTITLDDNMAITALVLHHNSLSTYNQMLEHLLNQAKGNRREWPRFWRFKDSFHNIRHGYAITAHRSQGSTYTKAFVDVNDILMNRNRQEAFRCLYVACTRPKKQLIIAK